MMALRTRWGRMAASTTCVQGHYCSLSPPRAVCSRARYTPDMPWIAYMS
jgi:hypothetical protein